MNELAETLRRCISAWDCSTSPQTLTRAADIIANLPEEPEGYRCKAVRHAEYGEEILAGGEVLEWTSSTRSSNIYPILEPVSPKFKPGDIVCSKSAQALGIVTENGDVAFVGSGRIQKRANALEGWRIATDKEKECHLTEYTITARKVLNRLAREVYGSSRRSEDGEDKP